MDFKTLISADYIQRLGCGLEDQGIPSERVQTFGANALRGLEPLALKARVEHVRDALSEALHALPFASQLEHVLDLPTSATLGQGDTASSFELWPLTSWVGSEGLEHPKQSLKALKALTCLFTGEFDIRPFLEHHRDLTLSTLELWRESDNHHVRRLVSEGTRAYLPWGKQVKWLRDEPGIVLDLIEPLRDDPEDYVSRSVANNINDMTRRHADWVVTQLAAWPAAGDVRQTVVKHALRSLVKKGHVDALALLGFSDAVDAKLTAFACSESVMFGGALVLDIKLTSTSDIPQDVVLDFGIHHVKANGERTRKVFKWKTFCLEAGEVVSLKKTRRIMPITTRRYYAGTHKVDILLNGVTIGEKEFELIMDE